MLHCQRAAEYNGWMLDWLCLKLKNVTNEGAIVKRELKVHVQRQCHRDGKAAVIKIISWDGGFLDSFNV